MLLLWCGISAFLLLALWRVMVALPARVSWLGRPPPSRQHPVVFIVLGSGGHTSEMLGVLADLARRPTQRIIVAVAGTDTTSLKRMQAAGVSAVAASMKGKRGLTSYCIHPLDFSSRRH